MTISPSSRLVNITAPTDLHRPSDPQVSTERPSSFSFAFKAVGPCTGMSADLQTRDGVHTRRPTPWHQVLRAASVARAARPAAWSFRRVDAKVGPATSLLMCAGTAYQTPSSVVSVGASDSRSTLSSNFGVKLPARLSRFYFGVKLMVVGTNALVSCLNRNSYSNSMSICNHQSA